MTALFYFMLYAIMAAVFLTVISLTIFFTTTLILFVRKAVKR